jgi:hypothetical protein
MPTIKNWTAKRSGAALTIEGVDKGGKPVKVVNVASIKARADGAPVATDFAGKEYALA